MKRSKPMWDLLEVQWETNWFVWTITPNYTELNFSTIILNKRIFALWWGQRVLLSQKTPCSTSKILQKEPLHDDNSLQVSFESLNRLFVKNEDYCNYR
ncbi:UNVERIFIED_CONTAM: hypothetical protein NCL1_28065 [Trichonephila clavipes]